jgi:hypothetical protein
MQVLSQDVNDFQLRLQGEISCSVRFAKFVFAEPRKQVAKG